MRTFLILLSLFHVSYCIGVAKYLDVAAGKENVELNSAKGNVKTITRKLAGSEENGKPVTSTNFTYKAPGAIIIKKVTKEDAGLYDYELIAEVTDAQKNLPEGVFLDVEPMLTGIELNVI